MVREFLILSFALRAIGKVFMIGAFPREASWPTYTRVELAVDLFLGQRLLDRLHVARLVTALHILLSRTAPLNPTSLWI